jgi:hypothetical protein
MGQPSDRGIATVKSSSYIRLTAFLLVGFLVVFVLEYGRPVSRGGLRSIQVTDLTSSQPAVVSIDGSIRSSSFVVSSVKQIRKDGLVVIVVREGLRRPGRRSRSFHCDVAVSAGVNRIAFGDADDVIWQR